MGRPKATEQRDTRQEILNAALEVFAAKGFFGSSMRDMAKAVGVRESAIYHYFSSKEALFETLLGEYVAARAQTPPDLLHAPIGDVEAFLVQVGVHILGFFTEPREQKYFRIMMCDGLRMAVEGKIQFFRQAGSFGPLLGVMQRLLDEHLIEGTPEVLTLAFIGPFLVWRQRLVMAPNAVSAADNDRFVRQHVAQFLRGARPQSVART